MDEFKFKDHTYSFNSIIDWMIIGTSATHAFADDPFKNKVNIDTDAKQKNDCETDSSGTSSEGCLASDKTTTDTINVQGEKNKVDLDFDAKEKIDCEGEASATNSVVCKALVYRNIGEINITPIIEISTCCRRIDRPHIFFIFNMQLCGSKYYSHQIVCVYLYFKAHKVLV